MFARKRRSPRFPFVSLPKAIELLRQIAGNAASGEVTIIEIAHSLGHQSVNGTTNKQVAALVGYGLLDRMGKNVEGIRAFGLNGRAKQILSDSDFSESKEELRKAALTPPPFHRIWFRNPGITKEELQSLLRERGFTEEGAERSSGVYLENVEFADLEDADFRASGIVAAPAPRGKKGSRRHRHEHVLERGPGPAMPQRLVVPIGEGVAMLPARMTAEEYDLLLQTLALWKDRLIASTESETE